MLQADYDRILTNFNAEMHKNFFFFDITKIDVNQYWGMINVKKFHYLIYNFFDWFLKLQEDLELKGENIFPLLSITYLHLILAEPFPWQMSQQLTKW